jgi:hypothetical protein
MVREGHGAEAQPGGFDRSFLIVMIRDFFVILVIVTAAEFALKAGMVVWKFQSDGPAAARAQAETVADNVRAIMLNEGGPVAARALYPIIQQNLSDLGWTAAIEPSPVTVDSIEESFGFRPRGAVVENWPEGRHNEGRVELRAEAFCQTCHVRAEIGEVLGVVTVRRYLSDELAAWRESVQLTGMLSVGKIVLHSILLFLLLRARMAPLMRLREVVGGLSRAFGGLDARVRVASADEFGALSRDLNLFLDRIQRIVGELDSVLRRVVSVNDDIMRLQTDLRDRLDGFAAGVRRVERRAMIGARREPMLSTEWFEAMRAAIEGARTAGVNDPQALAERLAAVVDHAERQVETNMALFEQLAELGEESEVFRRDLAEMTRLEERMRGVIESGAALLARLQRHETPAAARA